MEKTETWNLTLFKKPPIPFSSVWMKQRDLLHVVNSLVYVSLAGFLMILSDYFGFLLGSDL
jgi:hypothetical protein